jgi:hypothetical protein
MSRKKIKWIIAREGLIFIGLGIILYFLMLFLQNIPVVLPKYRLEFTNGQMHSIMINPEIRNDSNYKRLLREVHNPSPKLIEKRIREFMQMENIKSSLKQAKCINSTQLYVSELYSFILGIPFIFKVFVIYLFLLFFRFILWAIKILKGK